MKLKYFKNLKTDSFGYNLSNFNRSNYLSEYAPVLYDSLNKNSREKKILNEDNNFKLKLFSDKINFFSSKTKKKKLDFNSTNSKNVFLRTKRKSSYGQTLLEKQRLKKYIPYVSEKSLKNVVLKKNKSIFNRLDYVMHSSNIFNSKNKIKKDIVYGNVFYQSDDLYSYILKQNQNFLRLSYVKSSHAIAEFSAFKRVIPTNFIIDFRLNKIKNIDFDKNLVFSSKKEYNNFLPYDFDLKKIIQHYRLKRN